MLTDQVKEMRVTKALEAALPGAVVDGKFAFNELTLEIDPARIVEVGAFLKNKDRFIRLSAVTCVDWYPMEPRFEVVYHLHSMPRPGITEDERLRLKCRVTGETPSIDSVFSVWRAADWYEREVFDLFAPIAPLRIVRLPVSPPAVAIHQYWHPRVSSDPALRFFREQVLAAATSD